MTALPKWFKPIAVVALLWNLLGCVAFISDLRLTPDDLAKLSVAQQAMYAARPGWSVAATGLAVLGGSLGSIGLFVRKRWSYPVLGLSLLGVIVQDVSMLTLSHATSQLDVTALALQGAVVIVAVALLLLARKALANGWIS